MSVVLSFLKVSKVSWKLRQVLADRKLTNKALADKLGIHPTSVSRLKSQDILPAIGGDEIEKIRVAIAQLSQEKYGTCTLSELVKLEEYEDSNQ